MSRTYNSLSFRGCFSPLCTFYPFSNITWRFTHNRHGIIIIINKSVNVEEIFLCILEPLSVHFKLIMCINLKLVGKLLASNFRATKQNLLYDQTEN